MNRGEKNPRVGGSGPLKINIEKKGGRGATESDEISALGILNIC